MPVDQFTERLATVRHRFTSTLVSKIKDSILELPRLSGASPGAVGVLDETYRRIHGIAGIGAAVGFAATGRAARKAESVLLIAHSAGRGLKADEMAALSRELIALREAAQRELDLAATSGM
jgi:chemotaxis protein histidine kinase CheA